VTNLAKFDLKMISEWTYYDKTPVLLNQPIKVGAFIEKYERIHSL